ncbi:MAG: hypothetical protein EHM58_10045 [Ignavibacteriae bacterium]|nr:MAG: hypothetical protein EHM58_10045 [Ignavibacteriota bacterium]
MNPSQNLFYLIKSLSANEKRYFKMYCSLQSGDKNYLRLFEAIDEISEYDETLIKEQFKKEKFIRQLTFTKNYLYNLIFKSLYSYYSKHSIESRLNDLVFRCCYFYKKALFKEFRHSIDLGKKLSLEYERFGYFIQFSSYEKILLIEKIFPVVDEKSILLQEELTSEKISNLFVYESFAAMLTGIYREEGRTRDKALFQYIERIKQSPLLTSENYALSSLAKERYYFLLQLISDIYGDFDNMYKYCRKRLEVMEADPKPFSDRIYNYWRDTLMYLILLSIRLDKQEKLIKYLNLLEMHSNDTASDKIYLFLVQSYLSIQLIITEKRWDKVNELMESIEKGLKMYKGKMDSNFEIILYDLIARMLVESGQYNSSLVYINLLLQHPYISIRRDIEYNARLLNLIIHYELNNFEYLEYLIISTYRFLYKRKKIYKLETLVINFIKQLSKVNTNEDLIDNFKILQKELKQIYVKPHEKNVFLYFNYPEWVNKKLKEIQQKHYSIR